MQSVIHRYLMITLGSIVCALGICAFFMPYHLLSGGVSGLCILLYYVFKLPVGVTNIILNIPLFYLAYKAMSKDYVLCGIFGMLVLSISIDALTFLGQMYVVRDMLLSCIAGGVIQGIGSAMMYRVNGNTGGMDIIGAIIQKHYSISIGTSSFIFNLLLLVVGCYFFGIEITLYTMLAFYIAFRATNAFTDGFDFKKSVIIVSEKYEQIADEIMKMDRGVTYLDAEGAYTGTPRKVLFVVVKLTQIAKIRGIVTSFDPNAFMIIQDASDVLGRGFTEPTIDEKAEELHLKLRKANKEMNITVDDIAKQMKAQLKAQLAKKIIDTEDQQKDDVPSDTAKVRHKLPKK
jgi:uncharacterized membrane-anchored protein YitT (DUF2179 family)